MNIVISIPVDESLAAFVGKKGSANSITFYNRKFEKGVIVVLFPSQEDEKIYALAESLLLSSQVVLSTSSVDRKFGEALVAASLLDRPALVTNDNEVEGILRSSGIKNYHIIPKEDILNAITANPRPGVREGQVRVDIDKAFPVKGIGTVALGIVTRGFLKQHDKLYHTSGKQVTVRSIQSQDADVTVAEPGTRIGVSLKEVDEDEIKKGDLLTNSPIHRSRKLIIEYKASAAAREEIKESKLYGLAMNFSYSECTITRVVGSEMELELSSPIPAEFGDEVLLIRKQVPRIFASGKIKQILG